MLVYLATNKVNGMQYVGVTTRRKMSDRIREHFRYAKRCTPAQGSFQEAIKKYGQKNISFKTIQLAKNLEELSDAECVWIEKLNTMHPNGYNLKKGGVPAALPIRDRVFTVDGKKYSSVMSLADAYNIDHHTLRFRLFKSVEPWSLEQALGLEEPPKHEAARFCKPIKVNGNVFKSHADACRYYGVKNFANFRQRLRNGWSVQQALGVSTRQTIRKSGNEKCVMVDNKQFESIASAARKYNISSNIVVQRLGRGWTTKQSLGIDPPPKKKKRGKSVAGYASIAEAAKANNLNTTTLHQRLKNGWDINAALSHKPQPGSNHYNTIGVKTNGRQTNT